MPLSLDVLRNLLKDWADLDLSRDEMERLWPRIERHFQQMRELRALDLGGPDPRSMAYMRDLRLGE